jgi:hypothetical protein
MSGVVSHTSTVLGDRAAVVNDQTWPAVASFWFLAVIRQ